VLHKSHLSVYLPRRPERMEEIAELTGSFSGADVDPMEPIDLFLILPLLVSTLLTSSFGLDSTLYDSY